MTAQTMTAHPDTVFVISVRTPDPFCHHFSCQNSSWWANKMAFNLKIGGELKQNGKGVLLNPLKRAIQWDISHPLTPHLASVIPCWYISIEIYPKLQHQRKFNFIYFFVIWLILHIPEDLGNNFYINGKPKGNAKNSPRMILVHLGSQQNLHGLQDASQVL